MERVGTILNEIKTQLSEIEDASTQKVLNNFYDVIEILSDKIDDLHIKQDSLEENIQYMDKDLTSLQDEVFEEISFEDLEDIEDEYIEVKCNKCDNPLFVEKDVYESKNEIPCPFCQETIKF